MSLLGRNLHRQAFAPFVSASFEHGATGGRAHSGQEPVRAFAS